MVTGGRWADVSYRESGKKLCEYDFGDQIEVMHEMLGMMEKSKYCRNVLAASLLRTYHEKAAARPPSEGPSDHIEGFLTRINHLNNHS